MAAVGILSSNIVGLRVAKEASLKVLPGSPIWNSQDPNTFSNFGGEIRNMERDPIRDDRQNAKGVTVALSAAGEYTMDFTYSSMQFVMPSFMYANFRPYVDFGGAGEILSVTTSTFTAASGLNAFIAGDLVLAANFSKILGNNGLHRVTTAVAGTLTVAETMIAETPPAAATLVKVGFQCASADLNVVVSGPLPVITSTAFNPVTQGIIPGEWIYIGDDTNAAFSFANAANNGWKRVRAVTATSITIDKSRLPMVVETGTGKTVRIYLARRLKNETGTNIVRTSLQFERTLGAPDDALPTQVQSEYLLGAIGNVLDFEYKAQDKLVCTLGFIACDVEQRTGAVGVKTGTRPLLASNAPALNTSSSVKRIKLASVSHTDEAPASLAGEVLNIKMSINNNLKGIAVIGSLGFFEIIPGNFKVTADMEALFLTVAAQDSVRNNADVTLDLLHVLNNTAMVMDMPLLTLGDGRAKVVKDDPISIPITAGGNSGEEVDAGLDHTLMFCFFDYTPTIAATLL